MICFVADYASADTIGVNQQHIVSVVIQRHGGVIARVPDSAPWLMIAWGLDVSRWFADDLIDATMLSPFPRCREDLKLYPEYHIDLAHKHGKMCIGGIGSRELQRTDRFKNTGFFHPKPVYQLAARQYKAQADAMSLYQTESLARMNYLEETIKALGDRDLVARRAEQLPDPQPKLDPRIGLDWHTRLSNGESLRSGAGEYAM